MYSIFVVIVIMIIIFFAHMVFIMIDKSKAKAFTNGTWIDRDGNLLVMKINKNKILISFGVNTENDEYELTEKEYSFRCIKLPLSYNYSIKVNNGIKIAIDIVSGTATVYDKKKKIGKFAKNNLILLN